MITELRIRGVGVIDEAVIEFAPGLTVVTGETGAGKTMVLTGLSLLRGAKADPGIVRTGSGNAHVDGAWTITGEIPEALAAVLDEAGVELDELDDADSGGSGVAELVLGRSVAVEGRSRAFAGGRMVPAGTLGQVADALLAVHGQADQVRLTDSRRQREILDRFGQLSEVRAAYQAAYREWKAIDSRIAQLRTSRQELDRHAALLRLGIAEIDDVAPTSGEDEELKAKATVLAHATDLAQQLDHAHELLSERDSSALVLLGSALREVERAASLDPTLEDLRMQLVTALEAVQAVAVELAGHAASVDSEPGRLEEVEERRKAINQLKRKYGPTLDEVLTWHAQSVQAVTTAEGADEELARLEQVLPTARLQVISAASELSMGRGKAADALGKQVTDELAGLAMVDASVSINVESALEPEDFGSEGADTVEFLLRPHAGATPRPIGQGASGGELSRIMLAIEVCLAGQSSVPTFIFDEVDAGIGGRVAVEVGTRLARLAQQAQVIVVTHLPQVAAFADRHVVVRKETDGRVTSSSVQAVEGESQVAELVRMLSGLEGSASGAEHAAELLQVAHQARQSHATPKRAKRRR